jgi:hypothetical protein
MVWKYGFHCFINPDIYGTEISLIPYLYVTPVSELASIENLNILRQKRNGRTTGNCEF